MFWQHEGGVRPWRCQTARAGFSAALLPPLVHPGLLVLLAVDGAVAKPAVDTLLQKWRRRWWPWTELSLGRGWPWSRRRTGAGYLGLGVAQVEGGLELGVDQVHWGLGLDVAQEHRGLGRCGNRWLGLQRD